MLRTACLIVIRRVYENDREMKKLCKSYIREEKVHTEIRNLIMMVLLPKKLHVDDKNQAAFVRAAVSRVITSL